MWRYWCQVAGRAFTETAELMGWGDPGKLAIRVGLPLIGIGLAAYLGVPFIETISKAGWLAIALLSALGAFLVLFLGKLTTVPPKLQAEAEAKTQMVETELNKWNDLRGIGRELEALYNEGQGFFQAVTKEIEWRRSILRWFARVDTDFRGRLPDSEQFMLQTVLPVAPSEGLPVADTEALLRAKLEKLRRVISRCLRNPRQNDDGD